jgi:hypothetical protein
MAAATEETLYALNANIALLLARNPALVGGAVPVTGTVTATVDESTLATSAKQDTLAGLVATAAKQDTGNGSLATLASNNVWPKGPVKAACFVAPVTATSAHLDISTGALHTAIAAGKTFRLTADSDGDVFYYWSPAASGDTVDSTATGYDTGATQCDMIAGGTSRICTPPTNTIGLVVKGTAVTKLRIIPIN